MTSELRCPPSFSAWRRRAGAGGRRHRARPCSPRAANNRPAPPRRAAPRRFPAPAGAPRRAPPRTGRRPAPASPAPRPTPRPPRGPHRYLPRPLSPAPAPGPHRPGARSCLFPRIPSVPAASPASTHPRARRLLPAWAPAPATRRPRTARSRSHPNTQRAIFPDVSLSIRQPPKRWPLLFFSIVALLFQIPSKS